MVKRKQLKRNICLQLAGGIALILMVNYIGQFKFHRFDLTSEKRYTLSKATKNLLLDLEDIIYVRIYLEGDFPAGFIRLQRSTKEMLDEFRAYSKGNIEYEFINPSSSTDPNTRTATYKELIKEGLQPTTLQLNQDDGSSQKIIFPSAIFTYKEREMPLQLLKSQMGAPHEVSLNNSIQSLEYEIANTIRKLRIDFKPKIAFIEGHGELNSLEVEDISRTLSDYYRVERKTIGGKLNCLDEYKAIVIAKPRFEFSEKDKFVIDQFIMRGGKTIWFIDQVVASMDSLASTSNTMAVTGNTNLDDQLFRYGCRVNGNLILDLQAAYIPINTAPSGSPPKWDYFPWIYFPLIMPAVKHPIVNNLNAVKCEFVSSIDTVTADAVAKTFLLVSSRYSKVVNAPVNINLQSVTLRPDEKQFNSHSQPLALLLEGVFHSNFKNRIPPEIANNTKIGFRETSENNKMIVVADGDIIRNQVQKSTGRAYPLGFDKYTGQEFGNKDFVMNCFDYLCDESNLISLRSRELKLRLLDKTKITNQHFGWQLANTGLPVLLVLLIGLIKAVIRKRKYGSM